MKNIVILAIITSFFYSRELEVDFISENPWLTGHSWISGTAFNNSVTYGLGIYGTSSIDANDAIDVELHLSENPDSTTNSMVFSSISFGQELGVGTFPGSAWDVSDPDNPRRLNICFFENNNGNLLWDPVSVNGMDLEYLIIMNSDYDDFLALGTYLEDFLMQAIFCVWIIHFCKRTLVVSRSCCNSSC